LAMVEFLILLVLLIIAIVYFRGKVREVSARADALAAEKAQRLFEEWRTRELTAVRNHYEAQYAELKRQYDARYAELRNHYEAQYTELKRQMEAQYAAVLAEKAAAVKKEYEAMFERWKQEYEEKIRQDAVQRSLATILGRVGEELAPLLIFEKLGIGPKDIRHIGTPVDYVAFRGLSEGRVDEVVFIEVKTGRSSALSDREKAVKRAVEEKRVRFAVINVKEELERLLQRLQPEPVEEVAREEARYGPPPETSSPQTQPPQR
jgi:predicted Holliday junction resolvase-like endonuclease